MKKKRRFNAPAVLLSLCVFLQLSCGKDEKKIKIGVSMPTVLQQRWNQDGENIKQQLENTGYEVDLRFAENDASIQQNQIEDLINSGVKILVITAVDSFSLTEVLKKAKAADIPVISYDRLIMNSDAVKYYTSFDNFKVGQTQGRYIKTKLNLPAAIDLNNTYNIEFVTGALEDNNTNFFFGGAMHVLKPYLDSGVLAVPSGETKIEQAATKQWLTENAQARFEKIIESVGYGPGEDDVRLHAVLCSNDTTANGVTNALLKAGYTKENFPVITGQDCDVISVKNMTAGLQSMSVFKDTRILAGQAAELVNAIAKGLQPPVNDSKSYNNGTGAIPSFLCDSILVEPSDIVSTLINGGYYTSTDIGLKD
ncbi:MAG: sugar-binding protein [Spirochaetaceae bacterium]|jgi:putative multiple sugar transport system substrate-binding protein|nr:sugar-binding protein [Spirochaetaceae bacterium]